MRKINKFQNKTLLPKPHHVISNKKQHLNKVINLYQLKEIKALNKKTKLPALIYKIMKFKTNKELFSLKVHLKKYLIINKLQRHHFYQMIITYQKLRLLIKIILNSRSFKLDQISFLRKINKAQDKNIVEERSLSRYLNLKDIATLILKKTGFVLVSKHPSTKVKLVLQSVSVATKPKDHKDFY